MKMKDHFTIPSTKTVFFSIDSHSVSMSEILGVHVSFRCSNKPNVDGPSRRISDNHCPSSIVNQVRLLEYYKIREKFLFHIREIHLS